MTKRKISLFLLPLLFTLFVFPAAGEWHSAEPEKNQKTQKHESSSEKLARKLDLTKDQQEKIEALLKVKEKKMDKVYEKFRTERKEVVEETEKNIQNLLTPTQKEKYQEMRRDKIREKAERKKRSPSKKK